MKILKILIGFFLLFGLSKLYGQQKTEEIKFVDVVYMEGGSIFRGTIVEYVHGEKVSLKTQQGHVLTFRAGDVKYVRQERLDETGQIIPYQKSKKPYEFREQGIYYLLSASALGGTAAWVGQENMIVGTSLSGIVGYQVNRLLGAGLGLGVDYYYLWAGETVYPMFAEIRGYLKKQNFSPYYSMAAGYAFAFKNDNRDVLSAEGGMLVHPAFGFRFGGSSNANFFLDLGLKFQKASFVRRLQWGAPNDTMEHNMSYKRLNIRAGLIF